MPEYTLRIRRYDPHSGQAAHWEDHTVEMEPKKSVLDAILKVREDVDGSIGIRCSCQQAICGSCGVRMNGKPGLACNTHLDEAAARGHGTGWNPEADGSSGEDGGGSGEDRGGSGEDRGGSGEDRGGSGEGRGGSGEDRGGGEIINVEPMGNMPVIRDLIVDMDAVHWKKIQRVTPWLMNKEPIPEREYIVPHENMVDVTQTMACIQCGACVSDCLSMEVDPGFIGPAALAKAYRFVGDPRDAQRRERLHDLGEDPQGMYDCTHCFSCIDACPKGVEPMSQIMRLRRIASSDEHLVDPNNGERHEQSFATLIREYGLLHEAELLPRSYGGDSWFGKFHPRAAAELMSSLPAVIAGVMRRKISPKLALLGHKIPKSDLQSVDRIYKKVEGEPKRLELNLYVSGYEDEPEAPTTAGADEAAPEAPVPASAPAASESSPAASESEPAASESGHSASESESARAPESSPSPPAPESPPSPPAPETEESP